MSTLDELLALLPDNTTGEIDADDLRQVVTELWNATALVEARVAALEANGSSGGGDVFSVTGVWQVNPDVGATPQGAQMAGNTNTLSTATVLRFWYLDKLNQDSRAALLAATALFAQQKQNSANWVTFDVVGTPTVNGSIVTVPVAVQKASGVAGSVAWQEAAVVINVQTSTALGG